MHHWFSGLLGFLATALSAAGGTLAFFHTTVGDVEVELFDQDKPVTVGNFIGLVREGAYANTFFHRCVPGFVVQGGGFSVANAASAAVFTEYSYVPNFGPIANEFAVGPRVSNTTGTIAMAKLGNDPNSATSQFFFNLADNGGPPASLDAQNGGFTVFGRVVRGLEALKTFNTRAANDGVIDLRKIYGTNQYTSAFSEVPVQFAGLAPPAYNELVYAGIALLSVQVRVANATAHVTWNSVKDKPNRVETSATLPPVWQTLLTTNGNGQVLTIEDKNAGGSAKFYRVRVDF